MVSRWTVLFLSSLLMFGNYYAYDLPSSLNKPLQDYLQSPDAEFNYHLGLFYSLYSLPNIFLPLLGGWLGDKFGTPRLLIGLSSLVFLGQFFFALGVNTKSYWLMHLGRTVFGIGGESLSVTQSRVGSKWFKTKELALALGINLSVARLGSVFNDLISPPSAIHFGVPVAVWLGTLSCFVSFGCACTLAYIEYSGDQDSPPRSTSRLEEMDPSYFTHSSSNAWESLKQQLDFSLPFWLICGIMSAMYATVIPFNAIHSGFLQSKWYPDDPQTAGQIMTVPDVMSALLVPFVGSFVDKMGHRVIILTICGVCMVLAHTYFTFATSASPSPIYPLILLGFAYSLLLTFWPCIPLVVDETMTATAFGIATSVLNLSLTVFPIIVSALVSMDPTYMSTELFFVACSSVGVLVCLILYRVDQTEYKSVLENTTMTSSIASMAHAGHSPTRQLDQGIELDDAEEVLLLPADPI